MGIMKIKEGPRAERGAVIKGGCYSRFLTLSAAAMRWQSTKAPSPSLAESQMSDASATRAAAAACTNTTMNAAARFMQPLPCAATHLKISQCVLLHASNKQRTQAMARQAQRTAAPALSSRDPASHAPLSTQTSDTSSWRSRAHWQAQWPVAGT